MSYKKQLLELCASGAIDLRPGATPQITVSHDDWCMVFSGGGCNCEPDIRLGAPQPNRAQRRAPKQGKS